MSKIKISHQTTVELFILGIVVMWFGGCSFLKGEGGSNNAVIATRIYRDVKSDDDRVTMLREEIFRELHKIIKETRRGQVPVNAVFKCLSGLNARQVEFVKRAVRRYIDPPQRVTDPKVIIVKDFQEIVQRVLNYYYADGLSDIIPTWGK